MSSSGAKFQPYRKHVIMCVGESCSSPEVSGSLYEALKERLKALGLHQGPERIHRSKSSCLGVCQGGPVAVVYPEGVWYQGLDRDKIERVIQEHLIQNQPVAECVFHQLSEKPGE
ncbi:MAG: (2Fe-2S) ferredoxin domain-containing protein [Candidatus Omnitrophica bacterium]|nr:(2Fe-2S) ferredoxin domain-containing protein [Candidatus Omnitrophota bacterium]